MTSDPTPQENRPMRAAAQLPVRAWLAQGHKALAAGDLAAAREAYEQALALDPNLQQAWLGLVKATEEPLLVRALCERILQKWPGCAEAQHALDRLEARKALHLRHTAHTEGDGPEAAARAGAPLYRGPHGGGGELPWADVDLQGDDATPGAPQPRANSATSHQGATYRPATGPWLSILLIAATLLIVLGVAAMARREPQEQAPTQPAGPRVHGQIQPLAAQGTAPLQARLLYWPSQRWLEIAPQEGRLIAYEGRQPVRTLGLSALHTFATQGTSANAPARHRVRLDLASDAPGQREPAGAWRYRVELPAGDAWWLARWLGTPQAVQGNLLASPERIILELKRAH